MWEVVGFVVGSELGPIIGFILLLGLFLIIIHWITALFLNISWWDPLVYAIALFLVPAGFAKFFVKNTKLNDKLILRAFIIALGTMFYLYPGLLLVHYLRWVFNWMFAPLSLLAIPMVVLWSIVTAIGVAGEKRDEKEKLKREQELYPLLAEKRHIYVNSRKNLVEQIDNDILQKKFLDRIFPLGEDGESMLSWLEIAWKRNFPNLISIKEAVPLFKSSIKISVENQSTLDSWVHELHEKYVILENNIQNSRKDV